LLSRQRSSKRSTILVLLWFSRPDCDRAPSPRLDQGRQSRRREALTLPTREGACWRRSRRIQAIVTTSCSGEGTPGVVSKSEACFGRARRERGCLSFLRRWTAWSVAAPPRRGQSEVRPRRLTGGHDPRRPRALVVSLPRHAASEMALERMVPSRRP
jgi:hypothetical protein